MATADEYAAWIVKNSDKKGTPEFDTVAAAYKDARQSMSSPAPVDPYLGKYDPGQGSYDVSSSGIPTGRKERGFFDLLTAPFEMGLSLSQKPRAEQAAFIAPTVEALGMVGGATLGGLSGNVPGAIAGAGVGYAGANELMRRVGGTATPETLQQATARVGKEALTGATMDVGGRLHRSHL